MTNFSGYDLHKSNLVILSVAKNLFYIISYGLHSSSIDPSLCSGWQHV